jgi:hypothetical protein
LFKNIKILLTVKSEKFEQRSQFPQWRSEAVEGILRNQVLYRIGGKGRPLPGELPVRCYVKLNKF